METKQIQPAARYLGTGKNIPIYRFPPVFRVCIHNTLSTVIPASAMRHRRNTENFALLLSLSHEMPSMSPSERHVHTGTTCSTAHTDLTNTDQRFRNHSPPTCETLKSCPPRAYISRTAAASPCPLHTSPTPFPDQITQPAKDDPLLGSALGLVSPPSPCSPA